MAHQKKADRKNFLRSRDDNKHITAVQGEFTAMNRYCQSHHILCISCLQDPNINGELGFIHKCMDITTWNINATHNCIALPTKAAYVVDESNHAWDSLPCHQVDHNPYYTDEVSSYLNRNIWSKLKKQQNGCNVSPSDIKGALEAGSDKWRGWLKARGKQEGGTRFCWEHRNDTGMEDRWYVPFSMFPGRPPKRKPYPDASKLPKSVKAKLKQLLMRA